MNKKVELLFPITKTALFYASWQGSERPFTIPGMYVAMYNERIISHAFRYVFAHIQSDLILEIAKETKGAYRKVSDPKNLKVTVKKTNRADD